MHQNTGLIVGLHPANERWCYSVTTSLIGWARALNQSKEYVLASSTNCEVFIIEILKKIDCVMALYSTMY